MKPSRLSEVLTELIGLRWPAFVWGPPGVGKSSLVRHIGRIAGLDVRDLRASLLDPTDLRGIPAIENGRAVWCPPVFLPQAHEPPGILFLDEINAAPPLVQASLYQLVLDRQVGEYKLPDGWRIIAAGNRQQDRAVVFRMSSALANRFVHLDFDVDFADWRTWAVERGIHPWVMGFLGLRSNLLLSEPGDGPAYPTPRSWEMASDVLHATGAHSKCSDILPGIVGPGASAEFSGWLRTALREDDMLRIANDPLGAKLPDSMGDLYALTAWFVVNRGNEKFLLSAADILNRLPVEFAVILARDMIKQSARFIALPGSVAFMKKHGRLFTA